MFVDVRAYLVFFFFNDTATTEIYTLSLHDALPIYDLVGDAFGAEVTVTNTGRRAGHHVVDRKSTRLNSSHRTISYAAFCLKKKTELVAWPAVSRRRRLRRALRRRRCRARAVRRAAVGFFFKDTATPESYTLSLHDALPI